MAGRIQNVCDAVVALLEAGEAAGTFSKAIYTERQYDTELALEDTSIISDMAVPVRANRTRKSRGTWNRDVLLDVMVRKRFPQSDFNADGGVDRSRLDEYVELLEQIDDYLADPANHNPPTYTDALYIEDDSRESDSEIVRQLGITFPWVPKHLLEWHQYTGILRVGYTVEVEYTGL